MEQKNWYQDFRQWVSKSCPAGEWVYRGQPSCYKSILPSMLRPGKREFYDSRRLYYLDIDIGRYLFDTSPVFQDQSLFKDLITDKLGRQLEEMAYSMFGGPPASLPRLSFPEIMRALAQHYDYPTLFIDVSFHPLAAALFATHTAIQDGFRVRDEPATVFRWPATRRSQSRLEINGLGNGKPVSINVIDITRIHPLMRRPRNQFAGLATPVSDPKPVYQPFSSPLDDLEFEDMAALDCCERFELPTNAGETLQQVEQASMDALFPDYIDLGFSYVSIIALVSLIVHKPTVVEPQSEMAASLQSSWERVTAAARTLLDRECLRLVPGCPVTEMVHQQNLHEVEYTFNSQVESVRQAVPLMQSGKVSDMSRQYLKQREAEMRKAASIQFDAWVKAIREVKGDEIADQLAAEGVPQYTITQADNFDWILPELDQRILRFKEMLQFADRVPAYALEKPDSHQHLLDAFIRDQAYENEVTRELAATRKWLEMA
jgi:hypothetical protein